METPVNIDGIAAPQPSEPVVQPPAVTPPPEVVLKRMSTIVLFLFGFLTLGFIGLCLFFMAVLPDPSGTFNGLKGIGAAVAASGSALFLLAGVFGFMRIRDANDVSIVRRKLGYIRLGIGVVPALLIGAVTPLLIVREPALPIEISSPANGTEIVAPVSIEFSLEKAVEILKREGLTAQKFVWDFNGDGKLEVQTLEPRATALFERQGLNPIVATIFLSDGGFRKLTMNLRIARAVFSVSPYPVILSEPASFTVENLFPVKEDIESVTWDFGNGEQPVVSKDPALVHAFFAAGPQKVSVTVTLKNSTQTTFTRDVEVIKASPLPFPVTVASEPENLLSPAPFGVAFRVETQAPLNSVLWRFGDGTESTGERVKHTFQEKGIYPVVAEIRSGSGLVARITKIVRVVETLSLSDLTFDGNPKVSGNKISGEVPIIITLKPRTSQPLIDFLWEAPEATVVESLKTEVKVTYRREGTYTLTLLAQDPDNRAMRLPITIEVLPPSTSVSILMDPEGGVAPLSVKFDASETRIPGKEISGFEWSFSDEKAAPRQSGARVEHLFKDPGTFEVTTKVFTTTGESFEAKKTIVVRAPILDACISASRITGVAPLGVLISSDCSTVGQATTYAWDFGDGWTSDAKNPTHDFQKPGTYTVTLTLKDGSNTVVSDPLTITVTP